MDKVDSLIWCFSNRGSIAPKNGTLTSLYYASVSVALQLQCHVSFLLNVYTKQSFRMAHINTKTGMNGVRSCKRWWQHFGFFLSWLKAWIGKFKQQRCKKTINYYCYFFELSSKLIRTSTFSALPPVQREKSLTLPDLMFTALLHQACMECPVRWVRCLLYEVQGIALKIAECLGWLTVHNLASRDQWPWCNNCHLPQRINFHQESQSGTGTITAN